jgi:hypothetical protein
MTFTPPDLPDTPAAVRSYHRARLAWLSALYSPTPCDDAIDAYAGLKAAGAGLAAFLKACGGRCDVAWGGHEVAHKLDAEGRVVLERAWPSEPPPEGRS